MIGVVLSRVVCSRLTKQNCPVGCWFSSDARPILVYKLVELHRLRCVGQEQDTLTVTMSPALVTWILSSGDDFHSGELYTTNEVGDTITTDSSCPVQKSYIQICY